MADDEKKKRQMIREPVFGRRHMVRRPISSAARETGPRPLHGEGPQDLSLKRANFFSGTEYQEGYGPYGRRGQDLSKKSWAERLTGFKPEGSKMPTAMTEADVTPEGGTGKQSWAGRAFEVTDKVLYNLLVEEPYRYYGGKIRKALAGEKKEPEAKPKTLREQLGLGTAEGPPPEAPSPQDMRRRALEMAGMNLDLKGDAADTEWRKRDQWAVQARKDVERWKEENIWSKTPELLEVSGGPGPASDYLLPDSLRLTVEGFENAVPIEAIRGTVRSYFDPRTKQEYGTLAEALVGRHSAMTQRERVAMGFLLEMMKTRGKKKYGMYQGKWDDIRQEWIEEPFMYAIDNPEERAYFSEMQDAERQLRVQQGDSDMESEIVEAGKKNNLQKVVRMLRNTRKEDVAARNRIWEILERYGWAEDTQEVMRIMNKKKGK